MTAPRRSDWLELNPRPVRPALRVVEAPKTEVVRSLVVRARRLSLAGVGALPVVLVAVCTFGVSLRQLATLALAPALVVTAVATGWSPQGWRFLARAVVAGVVATALYDSFRFTLLGLGLLDGDPIPHLGTSLGLHPAWLFGYLWRYLGDGGGLAVTFLVLGLRGVVRGVLFGLTVCCGLLLTLTVAPHGQELLFPLNLNTVVMATLGHIIYGAVLGRLSADRGSGGPDGAVLRG